MGSCVLLVAATAGTGPGGQTLARRARSDCRRSIGLGRGQPRIAVGQQRAERLTFLDGGRLLVATCPRYHRVVLTRITDAREFEEIGDIEVGGRPVAVAPGKDRFTVLVRPHGDARHLEEAWWQAFDLAGDPIGSRARIGWDPGDFAAAPRTSRSAYVLTSGSAEERDQPSVAGGESSSTWRTETPKSIGRIPFDDPKDDPERLILLPDGRAAVSLRGSDQVARLDLSDPKAPKLIDRLRVPDHGVPLAMAVGKDGRLLVGDPDASAFWRVEGDRLVQVDVDGKVADLVGDRGIRLATPPREGALQRKCSSRARISPSASSRSAARPIWARRARSGSPIHPSEGSWPSPTAPAGVST